VPGITLRVGLPRVLDYRSHHLYSSRRDRGSV
jgi:hypothetical protein